MGACSHVCWPMAADETGESLSCVRTIVSRLQSLSVVIVCCNTIAALPVCSLQQLSCKAAAVAFGRWLGMLPMHAHHAPTSLCLVPEQAPCCRERYCLTWIRPCHLVTAMYILCHCVRQTVACQPLYMCTCTAVRVRNQLTHGRRVGWLVTHCCRGLHRNMPGPCCII
jgi:hypothetical protein